MSEWETVSGPSSGDGWETISAPKKGRASALGQESDTLQILNPFGKNFDTGLPIGANVSNALAGAGKSFYDTARGVGQMMGAVSTADVEESKKRDAPLMNTKAGTAGNIGGSIAQFLPAAFVPGANTLVGATAIGAGMGAVQPTGEGESRLKNTAAGGAFGAAGHGVGKLLGKAVSGAANKMTAIEQKVADKAAAVAASETASARSAAGNAAQNAYKQLEHLRELKALGSLSGADKKIAKALGKELGGKAAKKLGPAVANKVSTAQAYQEAIETEGYRAAKLAAEKLSSGEVKTQVMARLKRYGPAAVGGMVGNMIFPGLGGAVGGAATGLVLRPAIHSMRRLATNPAVQHKIMGLLTSEVMKETAGNPALPRALGLLGPSIYFSQE